MSRIVVTGGSGFIGSYLIEELVHEGHAVLNLDICRPHTRPETWREVDITRQSAVETAFADFAPDSVIHLAARTDTLSDDVDEYSRNWIGTEVTARAARDLGVAKYVSTSTQYVHATDRAPLGDDDFSPFTAYGESKVAVGGRHPFFVGRKQYGLRHHPAYQHLGPWASEVPDRILADRASRPVRPPRCSTSGASRVRIRRHGDLADQVPAGPRHIPRWTGPLCGRPAHCPR